MGKVAILCGDHSVGWLFVRDFVACHKERLGFVEFTVHEPILSIYLKSENIKHGRFVDEETTIAYIREHGITTVVLAWWPFIVHKINKLPQVTVINTHPSYLPYNRGKYPYYWAILDGTPFGATIHKVDDGIDTGSILWRKEVELTPLDTGESAYRKGEEATRRLLLEHLDDIAMERFPPGVKQDDSKATYHHSKEFELPPIKPNEMYDGYTLIQDCRARTFNNDWSGRRIEIDGKIYRIHLELVEEK